MFFSKTIRREAEKEKQKWRQDLTDVKINVYWTFEH